MWLALTLAVLAAGIGVGLVRKAKWLLRLTALVLIVVGAGTMLCWQMPEEETQTPDYGLLLGCGLENGQGTQELYRRCQKALQWMQSHPDKNLIVSGGDPTGQGTTEASVMQSWLMSHGAEEAMLLLEDRAKDTRENLQFSLELAQKKGLKTDTVCIITSDYHQTRAAFLARCNGQTAVAVSAVTPWVPHLTAAVREVYAFFSEWLDILRA